ncbi:MAG: hypothetical protein EZS28_030004 [Streblomastix strix]|uniref:Uncharacterized protein n=1 Tax=Streblomastix strix TaxID=222440 RepID=A0A5J4UVG9_9EUKA|nr:MAG: hypothetical protein EZS28_030004 [Streblomastix strix]
MSGTLANSCCIGWSALCTITLILLGVAYIFELPVGEPLSPKEYKNLAIYSWIGAGIYLLLIAYNAWRYIANEKKFEAAAAANNHADDHAPQDAARV